MRLLPGIYSNLFLLFFTWFLCVCVDNGIAEILIIHRKTKMGEIAYVLLCMLVSCRFD